MQDSLVMAQDKPDISALTQEYFRSIGEAPLNLGLTRSNDIRFTRWRGQSDDGKKHSRLLPNDQAAFPWDGASDTRIPIVDSIIKQMVDLCCGAFWRSTLDVAAIGPEDLGSGAASKKVIDWLIHSQLFTELREEVPLLGEYAWTYGWAALHIIWEQETTLRKQKLDERQIIQLALSAHPDSVIGKLPELLTNPEADDQTAELMLSVWPGLTKAQAKRAVKDLRAEGSTEFPTPTIAKNRPSIAALRPYDEVIFPPETVDIQNARVIFRRIWMTEEKLRSMQSSDQWDADWIDAAAKLAGRGQSASTVSLGTTSTITVAGGGQTGIPVNTFQTVMRTDNLIEVVYAYAKQLDENNVPGIYCTVFIPNIGGTQTRGQYGKHYLLDYGHGLYPFVIYRTESLHRKIVESRGVPEIAYTQQNIVKSQIDSLVDYANFNTLPPIFVPKLRGQQLRFGPAVQIPVMRQGEIAFMQQPGREPNVAFQLIQLVEKQLLDYFGLFHPETNPISSQLRQQNVVNGWLQAWTSAFSQTFTLILQYMPDEEFVRIANTPKPGLDSKYDLILRFDAREFNDEYMKNKLQAISQFILPEDVAGVIDRAKLIELKLRAIDPSLADQLIIPREQASQQMFRQVKTDLGLMALGNEAEYYENDPTASTKLNYVNDLIARNPKYQEQLKSDQLFAELLKRYLANLNFSISQQQNKIIGRIGVSPEPVTA